MSNIRKRHYDESDYCDIQIQIDEFGKVILNRIDEKTDFDPNEYDEEDLIKQFRIYLNITKEQFEIVDQLTSKTIKVIKSLKTFIKYYNKQTKNKS